MAPTYSILVMPWLILSMSESPTRISASSTQTRTPADRRSLPSRRTNGLSSWLCERKIEDTSHRAEGGVGSLNPSAWGPGMSGPLRSGMGRPQPLPPVLDTDEGGLVQSERGDRTDAVEIVDEREPELFSGRSCLREAGTVRRPVAPRDPRLCRAAGAPAVVPAEGGADDRMRGGGQAIEAVTMCGCGRCRLRTKLLCPGGRGEVRCPTEVFPGTRGVSGC